MEHPVENHQQHVVANDAVALEQLGHKQELKRNFSMVSMLGLAFAILNTWTALAASISLALPSGGPSSVVWGLIVAGLCNLCLAASLAEFLSAYPTAGGQYHWAAIISWKSWSRGISYVTGWINVSGWVALTATGGLLGSTFVLNVIALYDENYESKSWHQFLIYLAFNAAALAINAFANRLLPLVTKSAFYWSVAGFIIISITLFACASPDFQPGSFVYGEFINEVGWPDGLAWMLGLLQGAFALTGFDGVAHMIEEIPEPHIQGPRIMLYCIGIGMVSGFFFLSCLLFVLKDVDTVIESAAGPLLQIFMDATNNKAGSTCLLMFPLVCMLFTTVSIMATSSRMSYAFARDRGLPFSHVFARVHPTLDVPLNALLWTTAWVVIFGLIFLGSSSTFNAITAASVVALGVTYAIPPAINCLRGRKMLPETRSFKLPNAVGWFFNIVGICWSLLTTVLFVFPPETPVDSENMNYCVAAFGVILVIAGSTWIFDGRKHYTGPVMDVQGMLNGKVEGMEPVHSGPTDVVEPEKQYQNNNYGNTTQQTRSSREQKMAVLKSVIDESGAVVCSYTSDGKHGPYQANLPAKTTGSYAKQLLDVFLPAGYPHTVTPDYTPYQIYDSLQAFSSSIAGLMSNRAVLQGFGVGKEGSSATGAVLLSVLQESTGRLATILFAHRFGQAIEPECKYYRFMADIFNDAALLLDILTPALPQTPKILTLCAAGILRSLCGVSAGAAKASLSAHFAKNGNLAELNAKDGSQETVISLMGMLAGSLFVNFVEGTTAVWLSMIFLLGVHLWTNYQAVRSVQMRTLNRQRTCMVVDNYMKTGGIMTPAEVAQEELILTWKSPPLTFGQTYPATLTDEQLTRFGNAPFIIIFEFGGTVKIYLKKGATNFDALRAYATAYHSYDHHPNHMLPSLDDAFWKAVKSAGWNLNAGAVETGRAIRIVVE